MPWATRPSRPSSRRVDRRALPALECLEDRQAPATLTVNSTADTGNPSDPYLSLREAIAIVNSPTLPSGLSTQILTQISGPLHAGGSDNIVFDLSQVTGPITLSGTQLELSLPGSTGRITVDGGSGITVDGNNSSSVFVVDSGVRATLDQVTITHGNNGYFGGGISNSGTLTVSNSTLSSNSATIDGGGIYNIGGLLTVTNSTLTANTSSHGGGIFNDGGTLTVTGSTLESNSATSDGGGISSSGNSTVTVSNCTFRSNSSRFTGGGIDNTGGMLTVSNSTLDSNSGTCIVNYGTLTVSNSTLSSNSGGGIQNLGGTLTVSNSTLSSNSSHAGGGIYTAGGTLTVTNSTLSANSAYEGGGIDNNSGTLRLQNTIVAGNRSSGNPNSGPDIYGAVDSTNSSNNLVGSSDSTLTGISNGSNGNLVGSALSSIDPRLGPLADNGGPTRTHALLADSPARGAGNLTYNTATDQRGMPRTVGGQIDLGAYQSQSIAGPQVVVSDPSGPIDPPVNHVRLTFNHPMNPVSVTTGQFSLSGPGGSIAVTGVAAVPSTNTQQFDVSFAAQSRPGDYALVVDAAVRDIYGTPQGSPFTARFIVFGLTGSILTVNSTADTANPSDPYLTLREALAIVNSPTLPTGLSPRILAQISGTLHAHGSDAIVFDTSHVTGPILLGGTQLELSQLSSTARIRIDGGSGVTLDGATRSRVFQVDVGVQASLDHLTISHGVHDIGAGIYNNGGTLAVSDCTLNGNLALYGGGIFNNGTLEVSNSTLSSNTAIAISLRGGFGGSIFNSATLTVINATLSSNSATIDGGGIYSSGTLRLQNTIVAGNLTTDPYTGPDIYATVDGASTNNLVGIGDRSLTGLSNGPGGNLVGSPLIPIDPRLGPLADNGGPTRTQALLPDSPARGAGSLGFATATDQRGLPRTVGGQIDLGAYQSQSIAGPQVVVSDPGGPVDPPVNHMRLTFNHAMNPNSVTTGQFSLSGPGGSIALTGVAAVPSTNNQQFDVSFASRSRPGDYALLVSSTVRDSQGTTLGSPFTARFIVFGLTGSILTVNSTADTANPGDPFLTLREALAIVNSPSLPTGLSPQILAQISGTLHAHGSDAIVFDHTRVTGPITLGGTQLELSLHRDTARVRIDGGSGVTLDGNNASRLFQVEFGAQATLDHLTLTHGRAPASSISGISLNGGGIFNWGTLTVRNSILEANSANNSAGGGISNNGTLTVSSSTIRSNSTSLGGAIFNNSGGTVTVAGSTLSSNVASGNVLTSGGGGGITNLGTMTVTGSTLTANTVSGRSALGGGIYNAATGTLTVTDSTLSSNTASASGFGGGISNSGTLTVNRSTFSSNLTFSGAPYGGGAGGGIYIFSGTATVSNSTFNANSADSGGGVSNGGTLTLTNSTFTANSATRAGGGISNSGTLRLENTLVAGNHSSVASSGPDINGAVNSASTNNLVGIADNSLTGLSNGSSGNLVGSAVSPIDPRLGPLANNGGPTRTHALLADSPARGAGSLTYATATDQRGLPRTVGGQIDLGAYQTQTAVAGPQVVVSDPNGRVNPPVNHVRLTFNHPLDPASVTTGHFSLSGPGGSIAVTGVAAVPSTNNQQFDVSFASQTRGGDYALVVAAAVRDTYGTSLGSPFTVRFGLFSQTPVILTVNSVADTATGTEPYLTLREAIAIVNSPTLPTDLSPQIRAQISGTLHLGGTDTIVFDTTQVTGPITLGGTALRLSLPGSTASITIRGGSGITVDGSNRSIVFVEDSGVQATLDHVTISHGSHHFAPAGGISNSGTLTVTNSTLASNSGSVGGGINNSGVLMVSNSTLSGNSADFAGGGISNSGLLTVANSTFSGNASGLGGGIYSTGTVTVTNSTLSANSTPTGMGGGVYNDGGTLYLQNTIVAGNHSTDAGSAPDLFGVVSTPNSGNNLVGIGDSNLSGISNGTGGNLIGSAVSPIDPRLGPLANNGGPTRTHALLADSPARGAGSLTYATATDQRGQPRTVGGEIDLGAYQSQSVAGPQVVVSDPKGPIDPPVNHVRLTFNHPMNPSSLTTGQFSLSGPGGSIAVTGVAAVPSTNNQQFDISFASQSRPGDYALVVSAAVRDSHGTSLGSAYTARFILFGLTGSVLTVNSTADTANPGDAFLTLREAIAIVNSPTLPTGLSPQIRSQISGTLHAHGSDAIVFDTTQVTGPITLAGTQLELSLLSSKARVRIDGGSGVTLDGNNASRVFQVDFGVQVIFDHLTLTHGLLSGGDLGAGILDNGTLTVTNSTLSANSASAQGGGDNFGTLTVTNSTLAGNSAAFTGGGVANSGTLTVSNSTLSANSAGVQGGGINENDPSAQLRLQNTIVAGNQSGGGTDTGPDINGVVDSSSGYNLVGIGDNSLSGISNGANQNQIGTTASPLDPLLAPLGAYGGPTQTLALLPGSPALNAGDPTQAGTPDQRGVVRSGGVNIGAFQASAASFVVSAPASVSAGTPFNVTVAAYDVFHQLAVGYTGTVTLSSTDSQATLPGPHTFTLADGGSFTFTGVLLRTAGTQTIAADDGPLHGSADVTVGAGTGPGAGLAPRSSSLFSSLRERDHPDGSPEPVDRIL